MKRKPVVGETLYRVQTDHRFGGSTPHPVTVDRIGSKYFYLTNSQEKYYVETWRHAWDNPFYVLYESIEEIQNIKERSKLEAKLRNEIQGVLGKLNLDQLRRINAILEEKSNG